MGNLKALVYNKCRKWAGHTFNIVVDDKATVGDFKEALMHQTKIPPDEMWIVFGVTQLRDEIRLKDLYIADGYTLYVTPTTVEFPEYPNL
ncbi:unnamed protein product, partial [Mesorhabditis belari]|uniref:Ubiquitin-like domain-containing protein n=1 Tax=Mesorhabditis belari TaxID=2138241 RepID=A0AAF3ER66_9BILA